MKVKYTCCFVFSTLSFLFTSCKNQVDKQTLLSYLNDPDNGLKQETTTGNYKISMTYRPTDLILEQEGGTDPRELEEKKQEYNKYLYFILNMSLGGDKDVLYKGSGSQQQFSASLNRLNFGLSEFIYARRDQKDTLYLADYYVPNLYGMGGSTQILLAFPNEAGKKWDSELAIRNSFSKEMTSKKFQFLLQAMNKKQLTNYRGMKNKILKIASLVLAINFLTTTLAPTLTYALTAGPTAPEYTSFEPVDTTDMVNLATGDFTYNIPLLEVPGPEGGYPLALSYHAGISPEEEASWVGLGWSLNAGAINRVVNLNPDDVKSDIERVHDYWQGGITEYSSLSVGLYAFQIGLSESFDTYMGKNSTTTVGLGVGALSLYANISSTSYGESGVGLNLNLLEAQFNPGISVNSGIGLHYSASRNKLDFSYNASVGIILANTGSMGPDKNNPGQMVQHGGGGVGLLPVLGIDISTTKNSAGVSLVGYSSSSQSSTSGNLTIESKNKSLFIPVFNIGLSYGYTRYYLDEVNDNKLYGSLYNQSISTTDFSEIVADNYTLKSSTTTTPSTYDGDKEMSGSIPAYDFYSVTGQGVSGTIQPYTLEYGSLFRRVNNSKGVSFDYAANPYTNGVGFRFVGDFSNSFTRSVDPASLNLNDYLEVTSEVGKSKTDYTSSVSQSDFNKQKGMLASSNHVEWFTNAQILAASAPGGDLSSLHGFIPDVVNRPLNFSTIGYTMNLSDNIGGFLVTNETGVNYHYSLPVYNFEDYSKTEDPLMGSYREISKTMPYAYTWLITGITGPDYVDRTPLGVIDDNDWGYWVKFDYGKWTDQYKWRTPSVGMDKDIDSGIKKISYGKKQLYYLDAIRTRSHTALFVKSLRTDGKSVSNLYNGGYVQTKDANNEVEDYSVSTLKLDKILLFTNELLTKTLAGKYQNVATYTDLKKNGNNYVNSFTKNNTAIEFHNGDNILDQDDLIDNYSQVNSTDNFANTALRQLEFNFTKFINNQSTDYELCNNTPNSFSMDYSSFVRSNTNSGKLTLQSVSFKGLNNSQLTPPTKFYYSKNPNYVEKSIDVWGNYKSDFTLVNFDKTQQNTTVSSAANVDAWSLSEIQFPIGSRLKIEYESDKYKNVVISPFKNFAIKNVEMYTGLQVKLNFYSSENISNIIELQLGKKLDLKLLLSSNGGGSPSYDFSEYNQLSIAAIGTNTDGTYYVIIPSSPLFAKMTGNNFRSGNIIVNKDALSETLGGGLRVKSISVAADGIENIVDYLYSEGTTSYTPIDFLSYAPINNNPNNTIPEYEDYRNSVYLKFLPVIADNSFLPGPCVIYSNVIVQSRVKDNNGTPVTFDGEGSVLYEFETFNNTMLPRYEDPAVTALSDGTKLKRIKFKDVRSRIGALKKMSIYKNINASGSLLSYVENKTIYDDAVNFESEIKNRYEDQGRIDQVFMEKRTVGGEKQLMITEIEYYPNIFTRKYSKDNKKGLENESKVLGYDFYAGTANLLWTKDPYNNEYMTKSIAAYEVYPQMGNKVSDPTNKQMLTQATSSYQYKVEPNKVNPLLEADYTKIGVLSATARTWSDAFSVASFDGVGITQTGIWRPLAEYSWIGNDTKSLNESGVYDLVVNGSDYSEFNFANIASNDSKFWQKNSEVTMYNIFSNPIEAKDLNEKYSATLLDPLLQSVTASASNVQYNGFAYSGGEFKDFYSSVSLIKEGNVRIATGEIVDDRAHTGKKSLQVDNASDGYKFVFTPEKGRKYRASVWVYLPGNASTDLDNVRLVARAKNALGNFADVGFSGRQTNMVARGFYLLTMDFDPSLDAAFLPVEMEIVCRNQSATRAVFFDDFRVHPYDAAMVSYVYDKNLSQLTHTIDGNNLYTRYEYDENGRLLKTFREKIGKDVEILIGERRYNYGNK